MISLYPYFYEQFQCKGAACKKTCCQRWEIDIDEDSMDRYRKETGLLGAELKSYITCKDGIYSFVLNENGYCHFLKDGLCRLVLAHGEDYLCDICHMHPRFFKYLADIELCGIGLSCEKSCELLLAPMPKEIKIHQQNASHWDNQLVFVDEVGQLYTVTHIMEILGVSVEDLEFQYTPTPNVDYYAFILGLLHQTEPIDEGWTQLTNVMRAEIPKIVEQVFNYIATHDSGYDAIYFNRLFQYILYRQLDMATIYSLESIISYAHMNTEFILMRSAITGDYFLETANWSEQIEYDTENVEKLLQRLDT